MSPACGAARRYWKPVRRMGELLVGGFPVSGGDGRLVGTITNRDVVVKMLAERKDLRAVHAGELVQGEGRGGRGRRLPGRRRRAIRRAPPVRGDDGHKAGQLGRPQRPRGDGPLTGLASLASDRHILESQHGVSDASP